MPTIKAQVVKWGNSHAVRLPKVVLERAEMRDGDKLEIRVEKGRIALLPARPKPTLRDLVARITPENLHDEQDWGKPSAGKYGKNALCSANGTPDQD